MIKNKKALNQVEYISAMLIFLFGLAVIMYFAFTFNITQHKDYLTSIENNIKKETEITYSRYYSKNTNGGSCFNISLNALPENIRANTDNISIISGDHQISNNFLVVNGVTGDYELLISPNSTEESSVSCSNQIMSPVFSFEEKINAISYDKLIEFQEKYNSNYEELKQSIAENRDFTLTVFNTTKCGDVIFNGITISRYIPKNVEVTAGEFPAKLFIKSKAICDVKVTIKIWNT